MCKIEGKWLFDQNNLTLKIKNNNNNNNRHFE